ncbi:MAG: amino acid adenylation domain-containing protein [Bacteroidota bacterium]
MNNDTAVLDLLLEAKEKGISLFLKDEKLRYAVAKHAPLDKDYLSHLKNHKEEIIAFLEKERDNLAGAQSRQSAIEAFDRKTQQKIPLSFAQERLWFIDQLEGTVHYHIPTVLRLQGDLDPALLAKALTQIVERHEVLRMVIKEEQGVPYQEKIPADRWEMAYQEKARVGQELKAYIADCIARPFDLAKDYMLRAELICCGEEEHMLVLVLHHIAADGWSLSILVKDLVTAYQALQQGKRPAFLAMPIQYADYAFWQRREFSEAVMAEKMKWWKKQLSGLSPLALPTDFPRPARQSLRGRIHQFAIDKKTSDQLHALALREGATLFMCLLSSFKILLARYSRQKDICVGTPLANRDRKELEPLVGFFINTLALRSDLNGGVDFMELLRQVKRRTLVAYAHQEVPFGQVVEQVEPQRDLSRSPLFQVMFALLNTPEVPTLKLGNLRIASGPSEHISAQYDLTLNVVESSSGLKASFEYCSDLFEASTIERMADHFQRLLKAIVANPHQQISHYTFLSPEEETQLLHDFNSPLRSKRKEPTVIELFRAQATRYPKQIALIFEKQRLNYQEVEERSNQLANYLLAQPPAGKLIAVCLAPSIALPITILGILKAGYAYVPIDPTYPKKRIHYLLQDTAAALLITHSPFSEKLDLPSNTEVLFIDEEENIQKANATMPSQPIDPEALAYVIYTSGSTGQPKGVLVTHHNLSVRLQGEGQYLDRLQAIRAILLTNYVFDVSLLELFLPLISGGYLLIPSSATRYELPELIQRMIEENINLLQGTPGYLSQLLTALTPQQASDLSLQTICVGGESLPPQLVQSIKAQLPEVQLNNHYGPTETTIDATALKDIQHFERNIIGHPFYDTTSYIVDDHLQLLPIGVFGELLIGGPGVTQGYLNRPELTAAAFIDAAFGTLPTQRLYRTGDLSRWLPDGKIEFAGRIDEQIKIRGYRVELSEIEQVIGSLSMVRQCAVVAVGAQHKRLIAYLIPPTHYDKDQLQKELKERLPDYMVPAQFVELNALPLSATGKVDKKMLPEPPSIFTPQQYFAPRTAIEKKLANIWQDLLELEKPSLSDHFFEVGGHSLLAMRMVAAIRQEFDIELPVKLIFAHPQLEALARVLDQQAQGQLWPALQVQEREDQIPLSFSQERLWFIHQLIGSQHYHMPTVLRLQGPLNVEALRKALVEMVKRHEVLRTCFYELEGKAWQQILPINQWNCAFTIAEGEEQIAQIITTAIDEPFNLNTDHPIRCHLIQRSEEDHVLLAVIHHIAFDGWSFSVFVKELVALYGTFCEGTSTALPALPLQYADYAIWQRKHLSGEVLEQKMNYWIRQLDQIEPLNLPTDFPRPTTQSTEGALWNTKIGLAEQEALKRLAQQEGVTLFMLLLATLKVLLYRYSGQEDLCVGSPVANRMQKETEALVGFFVNTLALRSDLSGNPSFKTLLAQIKETTLDAYSHQEVPFEKIVEQMGIRRDRSRTPIFQVLFVLQNTPEVPDLQLGEVKLSAEPSNFKISKFDLTFTLEERPSGIHFSAEYCTALFTAATIERMMQHFHNLLEAILAQPDTPIGQLQLLSAAEEQRLRVTLNDQWVNYPKEETVIDLLERQVERTPDRCALVFGDRRYTYAAINHKANQLARFLAARAGVKPGDGVAVLMERSGWYAIAMIGIMKLGATYIPLDINYPVVKLRHIIEDSQAKVLLANQPNEKARSLGDCLDIEEGEALQDFAIENLARQIKGQSLSYIIYTSGSTGQPKGVEQTQLMLYNLIRWDMEAAGFQHQQKHLQFSSFSFDSSLHDIYYAFSTGGTIYLLNEELRKDLWQVKDYILEQGIATVSMPYSALKPLFDEIELSAFDGHQIEEIVSTGEQLYINGGLRTFLKHHPKVKIFNLYGPSETHVVTGCHYSFAEGEVPVKASIGKAVYNTSLYIFDSNLCLLPEGIKGEIYIGGYNLARGYRGRPELTAEKFIPNPYQPEELLYRSGDWGRWEPDGSIEYLGRIDDQVKIRGYRIELGEVETVLQACPLVNQCVVLAKMDAQDNKRLVAYLVAEGEYDKLAIQSYLQSQLSDYMIPSLIMELPELPLTSNGKVDKRALPSPEASALLSNVYVAPTSEIEKVLASIWKDLLQVERVGVKDNFFELGGHSLMAMRVVAAIRNQLQKEIPVSLLFSHMTIQKLAAHLETQEEQSLLPPLVPQERPATVPLSFAQERLWFIDQLEGSIHYHIPIVLRLRGGLDKAALGFALQSIVDRHEVLRTVFKNIDGRPVQTLLPARTWHLQEVETVEIQESKQRAAWMKAAIAMPFDLEQDHMLRGQIGQLNEEEHLLVLVLHHIAADGWSLAIFVEELVGLYNTKVKGGRPQLPDLPVQYADYALWQRRHLSGEMLADKLRYWEHQLSDVEPLNLPTDFERPSIQSTQGALVSTQLDQLTSQGLKRLAQQEGVTLFMLLQAALKILLYRYTGQTDICIGSPIANRRQTSFEPLIGFFLNTLCLRSNLEANPRFIDLLARVKKTTLEAYNHQDIPFEKIVKRLGLAKDRSRSPIFQVLFNLQNTPAISTLELEGLELIPEEEDHTVAKYDLSFSVVENSKGLEVAIEYCSDLFLQSSADRLLGYFQQLLQSIIATPAQTIDQLGILSAQEKVQLVQQLDGKVVPFPQNKTLVDLFREQVEQVPNRPALFFEDQQLSFRELDEKSNQLAHYLRRKGVRKERLVAICIDRSLEMMIGLLGILKAGGAYVPIDPDYPQERIRYLLADTQVGWVLSSSHRASQITGPPAELILLDTHWPFIAEESTQNIEVKITAENLAYVIYTSGSTGQPKGVMNQHSGVVNRLLWSQNYFQLDHAVDVVLQKTTFCFDVSVWELFWPMITGIPLVFARPEGHRDSQYLKALIEEKKITYVHFVPSMLDVFLLNIQSGDCPKLKRVLCSGEALTSAQVAQLRQKLPHVELHNLYGPTEAAIEVSHWPVPASPITVVPIGKAIANTRLYIMTASGEHALPRAMGELYIGGLQVARGYLNRPELTQERFRPDPFSKDPTARLYKTGDLVRRLPDGNIEYLGRLDHQVKIRGYRIELGEIEAALLALSTVRQCLVLAREVGTGNKQLIAYLVVEEGWDKAATQQALLTQLPAYMVPGYYLSLEALPLMPNGKVDRSALPLPDAVGLSTVSYLAPQTELEIQLASIWSRLLGLEKIGRQDSFFELGGHSLLAMRVLSAIREELGIELSVAILFSHHQLEELAGFIQLQGRQTAMPEITARSGATKVPLSFAQERIWFIDRLEGSTQYHIPMIFRLKGSLGVPALEVAFRAVVERHKVLRTIFREEQGQVWQVVREAAAWRMEVQQATAWRTDQYEQWMQAATYAPFDLGSDYMLRAHLLQEGEAHYQLIFVAHHIASDGWSMPILVSELVEYYRAIQEEREARLSALPIQYTDYALWQRDWLKGEVLNKKLSYWKQQLMGTSMLDLPTDFARPPKGSTRGAAATFVLEGPTRKALYNLAKEEGATPFMILLSLFKVLLYRYSNQEDICVGIPIANRTHAQVEPLIGFFLNTLALRSDLNGQLSFKDLLAQVRTTTLEAYDHQDIPFEKILEIVQPERHLNRNPLFQVFFNMLNLPKGEAIELEELTISPLPEASIQSKFDLTLYIAEGSENVVGTFVYAVDLFSAERMTAMCQHFKELVASVLVQPEGQITQLNFLSAEERKAQEDELDDFFAD